MSEQLGRMILYYRKKRGLSQADVAESLHVARNTISSWETGRTEPNMGQIEILSDTLYCLKSDLLGGEVIASPHTEAEMIARKFELADDATKEVIRRLLK